MSYMLCIGINLANLKRKETARAPGPGHASSVEEMDTGPQIAEVPQSREKANQLKEMENPKEKERVKEKVRMEKGQKVDASIVAAPTTHLLAQKAKVKGMERQMSCKLKVKTNGGNRANRDQTNGGNRANRDHITQCPRQ